LSAKPKRIQHFGELGVDERIHIYVHIDLYMKMSLTERGSDGVDWSQLAQWRGIVKAIMSLQVSQNAVNLLRS
jgi:hypothetical protein